MEIVLPSLGSGVAWFAAAMVLFFNPFVNNIYRSEDRHPAVKILPQNGSTIAKILLATFIQTLMWAVVFVLVAPALPTDWLMRGLAFGGIICLMKVIPRDIDRILLTTYPPRRLIIEFVNGILLAFVVGIVLSLML